MSLNRHNPFVAALSTLVEPAPAAPHATMEATAGVAMSRAPEQAQHPNFVERLKEWAAFGQAPGAATPNAPAATAPDAQQPWTPEQAENIARARKLFPFYY